MVIPFQHIFFLRRCWWTACAFGYQSYIQYGAVFSDLVAQGSRNENITFDSEIPFIMASALG
jgi:hypothetical protein